MQSTFNFSKSSKILVVSYTKKAVQELQSIIIDKFGINTTVTTFHSLAYKYVRQLFSNRKCEVVDFNKREEIFFDYINEMFKQKKIGDLIKTFNNLTEVSLDPVNINLESLDQFKQVILSL